MGDLIHGAATGEGAQQVRSQPQAEGFIPFLQVSGRDQTIHQGLGGTYRGANGLGNVRESARLRVAGHELQDVRDPVDGAVVGSTGLLVDGKGEPRRGL